MDLNVMMREQARSGIQAQLKDAVTNGDFEAANKAAAELAKLEVATAPKAAPYGNDDIKEELNKQPWFGTDPKKSAKAVELGKSLDPKKFATAALFAEALVKAVEEEFKAPPAAGKAEEEENEDGDNEGDEDEDDDGKGKGEEKAPRARRTDGPGEADGGTRRRTPSGPWAKLTDAPADVQKEIKRSVGKLISSSAPKETRDKFIAKALESHYQVHRSKAGKK